MRLAVAARILLAGAVLAGCVDTPQPFRHEGASQLARPRMVRAVAVRPPDDLPAGPALARALVDAFANQDIPALVGDDIPGGMIVMGRLDATGDAVDWVVLGQDHQPLASSRMSLPPSARLTASPAGLTGLAAQTVAALAPALAGTPDAAAPPDAHAALKRPLARIVPIGALPGDGAKALERSLRAALERSGIIIVASGGDYLVEGRVGLSSGRPGEEILKVAWVVSRADGGPLGSIDQQGAVAKGALEGAWGGLARDIAEGGAAGIIQVIDAAYRATAVGRGEGAASLQN